MFLLFETIKYKLVKFPVPAKNFQYINISLICYNNGTTQKSFFRKRILMFGTLKFCNINFKLQFACNN